MGESEVRVAGEVNRMIQSEVNTIYQRLENTRQDAKFPSFSSVNQPMVLVLGNHSSGKSTFINHMLGQEVQKTGRAPTDSTFTIMVGGDRPERMDGASMARHNKYGFQDIRSLFGTDFVSQVELKMIKGSPLLDDGGLMLVDSPGMIDPPGTSSPEGRSDTDRGYDFKQVVRWFADRADVILVMFDPDKPGTTFETLDVLTSSLRGLSSKMLLILNKVDDFQTVHDFARAYGALCWNLSKVIPRKDLPFIYTMYVPQPQLKLSDATSALDVRRIFEHEFDGIRGEVVREVQRAPDRATDNTLSLLKSTASRLKMHISVLQACRQEYMESKTFWKRLQIAGIATGVAVTAYYLFKTLGNGPIETRDAVDQTTSTENKAAWERSWEKQVAKSKSTFRLATFAKIVLTSCSGNVALWRTSQLNLESKRENVLQWLPNTFRRLYSSVLWKSDKVCTETMNEWDAVRPGLEVALESMELEEIPVFSSEQSSFLDDVLNIHLPRLDRSVRDRAGDDFAFLRFKYKERPSLGNPTGVVGHV